MGLGLMAFPAEAAPFAYVRFGDRHGHQHGGGDGSGGSFPDAVAVAPDGKHVYVAKELSDDVSVIAMATNTVVATVAVKQTGTLRYAFHAEAKSADLAGTKNPVQVSLTII
jgi:YVTN family beta-propeller protein